MTLPEVAKLFASGQLRFEQGKVILLNQPVVISPADFMGTLQKHADAVGNPNLIYFSAKEMGFRWFKNMDNYFKISLEDVIRWGVKTLTVAGWDQSEVTKLDSNEQIMRVKQNRGTLINESEINSIAARNFIRGCYASGAEVLFACPCDCIELSHQAESTPNYEFLAQPTSKFDVTDSNIKRQLLPLLNP